jgi:hypothetical protein
MFKLIGYLKNFRMSNYPLNVNVLGSRFPSNISDLMTSFDFSVMVDARDSILQGYGPPPLGKVKVTIREIGPNEHE